MIITKAAAYKSYTLQQQLKWAQGETADKQFLKAQALTYRAYCYMMLVQFYAKRWQDRDNGTSTGVVLRLDESTGEKPLSSLANCYKQIYSDLDTAIQLYQKSGKSRAAGISKELYAQIPSTDIRRDMFLDPKGEAYTASNKPRLPPASARSISSALPRCI